VSARTVLLTGGSSGIGEATVRLLVAQGYRVIFTYGASETSAEDLVRELQSVKGDVAPRAVHCPLDDLERTEAVIAGALAEEPSIYGFVHVAGTTSDGPAVMIDLAEAERVLRVNFLSMALINKLVLRPMLSRREGRILAVSSVAAEFGRRGNSIYSASKAAIEGYLRCLVEEVRDKGVTVNWVRPGLIDTRMIDVGGFLAPVVSDRVPLRRAGSPDEVAHAIGFLLSPEAAYIQGVGLTVDGGLTSSLGLPVRAATAR